MKNDFQPTVLYHGYDKLEIAFQGALSAKSLAELESAKAQAKEQGADILAQIGSLECAVKGYGTNANIGYSYIYTTGEAGIMWTAKRSRDLQQWNLRAVVSSGLLQSLGGLKAARAALYDDLKAMQADIIAESVGRVDYCVDIQMDKDGTPRKDAFVLEPLNFIAHSRMSREFIEANPDHGCNDNEPYFRVFGGAYVETVTLGRMPGKQIQVYNKRAESVKFRRKNWFEIWGKKSMHDCANVWRVEFRAGKNYLRDWNIKTIDDLHNSMGDICRDCVTSVRYVEDKDVTNVTRAANHILWVLAAETVIEAHRDPETGEETAGLVRGRIVSMQKERVRQMYQQQIMGLAASLSVTMDYADELELRQNIPDHLCELLRQYLDDEPDKWKRTAKKARARLVFINPPDSESEAA